MSTINLDSFETPINAVVIGASGGVGAAFCEVLADHDHVAQVIALSRSGTNFDHDKIINETIDTDDQDSVANAADFVEKQGTPHLIINATGLLHNEAVSPEKSLRDLSFETVERVLRANTIGPAVVMRYFLPLLPREGKSMFAVMTAKVGSISANEMGGWYAYRMAKCATNMLIKNAALELGRKYKDAAVIGLHPETVDTPLSKPFQNFVDPSHIRSPDDAVRGLLEVINARGHKDTGQVFDIHNDVVEP